MPKTYKSEDITLDRVRAWLNDDNSVELSDKDKEIYTRWDYAYDCLKIEKTSAVVRRLQLKFDISKEQAYRDIRNCKKLLNPINRHDAEWLRNFIIDDALTQIEVAKNAIDMSAWQKARADLIKIYSIESKENEGINPELLGHNQYFIAINFGNEVEKINLNELDKLPVAKKVEATDFLFKDIDIEDAKIIMES